MVNGKKELLYQWPTPSQRVWVGCQDEIFVQSDQS